MKQSKLSSHVPTYCEHGRKRVYDRCIPRHHPPIRRELLLHTRSEALCAPRPEPKPGTIGWRIREVRRTLRASRNALIYAMGGKRYKGYVNRVEDGQKKLRDYENVMLFCEAFRRLGANVTHEWLFYGRGGEPTLNANYYQRFPHERPGERRRMSGAERQAARAKMSGP